MRPHRLILALVVGLVWWGPAATAQDGARLVIVSPRAGSTIAPDVRVVVRLVGGSGEVPFSLRLDGSPTPVEASNGSDMPVASPGQDAVIILTDLREGPHELQAAPLSSTQAQASATVSFVIEAGGLSGQAILIAVILIGLLILYRSRVLAPWTDRYERKPPPDDSEP